MKLAKDFPVYCPNCGDRRLLKDDVGLTGGVSHYAVEQSTEYCLRCGFVWATIKDPAVSFKKKLVGLSDKELLDIIKFFYPSFSNLVKQVTEETKMSMSYVLRVVTNERRSADIDKALVVAFRKSMTESSIAEL